MLSQKELLGIVESLKYRSCMCCACRLSDLILAVVGYLEIWLLASDEFVYCACSIIALLLNSIRRFQGFRYDYGYLLQFELHAGPVEILCQYCDDGIGMWLLVLTFRAILGKYRVHRTHFLAPA